VQNPSQISTKLSFLPTVCPSCHPASGVKALYAFVSYEKLSVLTAIFQVDLCELVEESISPTPF